MSIHKVDYYKIVMCMISDHMSIFLVIKVLLAQMAFVNRSYPKIVSIAKQTYIKFV